MSVKKRYKALLDAFPGNLYFLDNDFNTIDCNDHLAIAMGKKTAEELIGLNLKTLFTQKELAKLIRVQKKIMDTGQPVVVEETLLMNDQKRYFLSRKAPLFDQKNKIIGMMGLSIDVTEVQKTEAAQLYKKRYEKLEMMQVLKEEFLENYFFDGFSKPLRTVIRCLSGLYSREEDPDKQLFLNGLKVATYKLHNHSLHLYNLYCYQKPLSIVNQAINLHALSDDLIQINKILAEERGIRLIGEYLGEGQALIGDYRRIRCILFNLLSNALRFTDKGEILVKIITEPHEQNPDQALVTLAVKDTGIGMKRNKRYALSRNFKKDLPESKQKGFVLGLHMVKKALDDLGGTMKITSEYGQGSEFKVTLPLAFDKGDPWIGEEYDFW